MQSHASPLSPYPPVTTEQKMKVLVLGATGFIGFPAAQALVRAGHTVYGLARTEAKAKVLAAEEIIPVLGEPSPGVLMDLPPCSNVSPKPQLSFAPPAPLIAYIYTSGTWVHGESRTEAVTDTTPLTQPVKLVVWRPALEQLVIRSTAVNGIVVRPSLLYGRGASILGLLFKTAKEGQVVWPGTPGGRYSVVHPDDLADFYLRVTERASLVGGKIFDASNGTSESVDDLLQRLVQVSGAKGYEYRKPENLFEEALASSGVVRPYLANALLGWCTKKPGLVDGLETYYAAWLASAT
ncbi:hypothetical protein C8R47DRAFT_1205423 [Mycena vitilis]|nr:hypothetical protein C8R47DRAFT_1205423 [Mycena vitilis]